MRTAVDPHAGDPSYLTFRVAIVGGGPRGLYCLESLSRTLPNAAQVQITVFEPRRCPGAGAVYDPSQPSCLRMNFATRHINAWPPECSADPERRSLQQWLAQHHPDRADPDGYVARALTGEYLNACYQQIVADLPVGVTVRHLQESVTAMQSDGQRWLIQTATTTMTFDEVMVTVGHQGWRASSTDSGKGAPIFPVDQQLNTARVPVRSRVCLRGFALTWIDGVLALTAGRGGEFFADRRRWRYRKSGREPDCLVAYSRSGRPMLAKPTPDCRVNSDNLSEIWDQPIDRFANHPRQPRAVGFATDIWPAVLATAQRALAMIGNPQDPAAWFANWVSRPMTPVVAIRNMRDSYEVAVGLQQPGPAWALGETWRRLYPSLVSHLNHGGIDPAEWTRFRSIATEMERLAFGPPAENSGRMLALVDAGLVSLRDDHSPDPNADVYLDAVLPSPTDIAVNSPLRSLLDSGKIRRLYCDRVRSDAASGGLGIEVNAEGRPVDRNGQIVPGLAILGRVTEGCIIGNDTLSRTLNRHPERWAAAVGRLYRSRHDLADSIPATNRQGALH